jgi:hypothetical protein
MVGLTVVAEHQADGFVRSSAECAFPIHADCRCTKAPAQSRVCRWLRAGRGTYLPAVGGGIFSV